MASAAPRDFRCAAPEPPPAALLTWRAAAARGRRDAQGLHSMAQQQRVHRLPFRFLLPQLGRGRNLRIAEDRHANSAQTLRSYRWPLEGRTAATQPDLCFLRNRTRRGGRRVLCVGAALCHCCGTSVIAIRRWKGRTGKEGKRPKGSGGRALSSVAVTVISGRRASAILRRRGGGTRAAGRG